MNTNQSTQSNHNKYVNRGMTSNRITNPGMLLKYVTNINRGGWHRKTRQISKMNEEVVYPITQLIHLVSTIGCCSITSRTVGFLCNHAQAVVHEDIQPKAQLRCV